MVATVETGIAALGKGRVAEAQVVAVLVVQGVEVYLPTFGNGICDLVALCDGMLVKVETKYSSRVHAGGYEVALRQVRPNRVKTVVKKFSAVNSDVLAVYFAPLGRVAFFSSAALDGRSSLTVREEALDSCGDFRLVLRSLEGTRPAAQPVPKTGDGQ